MRNISDLVIELWKVAGDALIDGSLNLDALDQFSDFVSDAFITYLSIGDVATTIRMAQAQVAYQELSQ